MKSLYLYVAIGALAQMIDGTLGMAYGVTCRSFLRALTGLPAPAVSSVIHIAELPASLVSAVSHTRVGNTDRTLLKKLVLPGILGGGLGAFLLTQVGDALEPFIDLYLILMGLLILRRALQKKASSAGVGRFAYPLGFLGGFLDATGGGGWGPVVTSTMMASGHPAKTTIGTVNTAEFFVTLTEAATFILLLRDLQAYAPMILGLIVGGVLAAPLAARLCQKIPAKPLMIAVGITVIVLNLHALAGMVFP